MLPFSVRNSAPSFWRPRTCRSTGRSPIAQPPGIDDGLASLREQRSQHADARPHRLDDVVAGFAALVLQDLDIEWAVEGGKVGQAAEVAPVGRGWRLVVPVDVAAQLAEQLAHRVDVAEPGHALQCRLALGQQARRHDRQGAVLAAADFDLALEALPAADEEAVHDARP